MYYCPSKFIMLRQRELHHAWSLGIAYSAVSCFSVVSWDDQSLWQYHEGWSLKVSRLLIIFDGLSQFEWIEKSLNLSFPAFFFNLSAKDAHRKSVMTLLSLGGTRKGYSGLLLLYLESWGNVHVVCRPRFCILIPVTLICHVLLPVIC